MEKHTSQEFFDKFWFINTSGDASKDCMVWGIEVGPGWIPFLWELCEKLEETEKDNPEFQVNQVKEKFGTLRFYTSNETDAGAALIQEAEVRSGKTCEVCGEPGKVRRGGWLKCLCELHAKKPV